MDQVGMDPQGYEVLHGAAANGHVETLQWFQDNGEHTEWNPGTLVKAAEAGQLKVVQWIIDRDRKDDTLGYESGPDDGDRPRRTYITCLGGEARLAIHAAAINGHLEVAKYLHAKIDKPLNQAERELETRRLSQRIRELWSCFRRSAYPNIDDVIKELSEETMMLAAERGFLDVVKWLYTQYHADPTVSLFWIRGHVGEYGHSYNPIDGFCSVVDAAAGKGHLAIVQYLLQVGGKAEDKQFHKRRRTETHPDQINSHEVPASAGCTTVAMNVAATNGHLDVVQWLHANCSQGCTTVAMDLAARNGHLETVKWLHANRSEGCTTDAMDGAAGSGHLHVVKWLHEHRSEGCTRGAMDNAAGGGRFEMLKWLYENRMEGCTAAAMDGAAANGHFDIVKWLHRHRADCTTHAMDGAAQRGHLRVLRWLFENRKEGFTTNAIRDAAEEFQFETLLVLHNIAQQGLAKEIGVMDAEQLDASISEFYLGIRFYFWPPDTL